ncbi:peptidyl-prolyl cis-trans isomerase CYP71-like [Chenopodium quinoa]|uniref:peptidyl-prolyl cis-trans isomerase CYP71-like n=1 Tax=Chenopodium quinoa TaxID=63459 RepID=UPI000B77565F|nr:peptidyl-prolyl cis-trans isomerase CYP71-like [Chenopodium quinoa]
MEEPQIENENGKLTEVVDTQLINPSNGKAAAAVRGVEEEEGEEVAVGPAPPPQRRPKRPLQFEHAYLDSLPCANMYEKSYMHRDVVTHVAVSCADFFITGSYDGHLKFWKKKPIGIEFAKHFRSHLGPIEGLAVSFDGLLCCTISSDNSVKVYDVVNYDMMVMIRLPYIPGAVEWVYKQGDIKAKLAISDRDSPFVHIYDVRAGNNEPIISKKVHAGPVKVMKYNPVFDAVISADTRGIFEYWDPVTLDFSENGITFKLKTDTNLLEMVKCKTTVSAIEASPDGKQFSVTSPDRRIRVFWYRTGKLRRVYDESLEVAQDLQRSDNPMYRLEAIDFGRRMAVEKQIEQTEAVPQPNAVFDESSNFLIYATLLGIKVVNLHTNTVSRILGKVESNDRFLRIALYQGDRSNKRARKIPTAAVNVNESKDPLIDPTLLCCAFKKHRLYLFSRREPEETEDATKGRDVFNEKPPADELLAVSELGNSATTSLPDNVILNTTMGDIHMKLYPEECPKTVENFTTHCRNGYYDNLIFHRVIKGFMVQTGDPLGDGTGGQSIWGREFEDEFHKSLRHDRPFTVSMANAGPNSNGSQFFITTVATPWLDNKHTVFGRVVKGMDVVQAIEKVKTDRDDKPYQDVKILSVTVPKS